MFRGVMAAVAAAFVASAPAGAATVTIEQVVNWQGDFFHRYAFIDIAPVAYQAGDTIDLTLHFGTTNVSGYSFPGEFSGVILANPSPLVLNNPGTAAYELLNGTGDFASTTAGSITQGIGYLPVPIGSPVVATNGSFDGLHIVYQVAANIPNLDQRISRIQVGMSNFQAQPVPEPATWAMMLGGFGLAGIAVRRRSGRQHRDVRV